MIESCFKFDSLLCGQPLVYSECARVIPCGVCGKTDETQVACRDGHFVCDRCHAAPANDLIEKVCIASPATDPVTLAIGLMKLPQVKMHGPEHHFLVPTVLLAAYYNIKGGSPDKAVQIWQARKRAENVLGGFCGFYGACGAGVGTGIYISLITDSTPLAVEAWALSNAITARSPAVIAAHGGSRCCKRDSFLALQAAVELLREHFSIHLDVQEPVLCEFSHFNRESLLDGCPFHIQESEQLA